MKNTDATNCGAHCGTAILGRSAKTAVTGAAAAVLIGFLSTGAASADTFVALPDGETSGVGVTKLTRTGESAFIAPSMSANGAGRTARVSGTITAEIADGVHVGPAGPQLYPSNAPGTNNSSTHGTSAINTGYIVGCQVSIGTSAISAGLSVSVSPNSGNVGGSIAIQLGPGQVVFVKVADKDLFATGTNSVAYKDVMINVEGCGGYSQARAYTNVELIGVDHSRITLYGQPFSIG
ncbi:MspA family porin [Nocardia sp. NPDC058633]|uniref:MspA family porin n=1 Tax=Nocardia sp. NPDC058633 TaxID=3346568 RepID=UPI00365F9A04